MTSAALLLVFIAVTGLILLYFVHKYRLAGIILFGAGALTSYIVYVVWVPQTAISYQLSAALSGQTPRADS